jgi:hypothetical protein
LTTADTVVAPAMDNFTTIYTSPSIPHPSFSPTIAQSVHHDPNLAKFFRKL